MLVYVAFLREMHLFWVGHFPPHLCWHIYLFVLHRELSVLRS